ncbi:MAG: hypothetical protein QW309_06145 [Zestosphaera sp.]
MGVSLMPVAVIGSRSVGKSVFVSLLANTAISYGVKMNRHFRLYMDPQTNKVVGEMLKSLKNSMWPPATLKGTLLEYEFSFGYSNAFQRFLSGIEKILPTKIPKGELFDVITFRLFDVAGEDVESLSKVLEDAKKRRISQAEALSDLPATLRYTLGSDVLVFLVDASKVTVDRKDPRWNEMINTDILMAQLYSFLAQYRSLTQGGSVLYPVFVLVKFDAMDPPIMQALGVSGGDYEKWIKRLGEDRMLRWRFFEKFMSTFFRQSLSQIYGVVLRDKKMELEEAPIFVSYVATELNEDGQYVPKVERRGLENVIRYSESEYEAFIRYFGKIAGKISDKRISEEESYVADVGGAAGVA